MEEKRSMIKSVWKLFGWPTNVWWEKGWGCLRPGKDLTKIGWLHYFVVAIGFIYGFVTLYEKAVLWIIAKWEKQDKKQEPDPSQTVDVEAEEDTKGMTNEKNTIYHSVEEYIKKNGK